MALKIHGMWYSNASGRVLATLYEKEVQFELIPVDIMKGEQKAPAYLALQPFGQIPTLQDGDLTLYGMSHINTRFLNTATCNARYK